MSFARPVDFFVRQRRPGEANGIGTPWTWRITIFARLGINDRAGGCHQVNYDFITHSHHLVLGDFAWGKLKHYSVRQDFERFENACFVLERSLNQSIDIVSGSRISGDDDGEPADDNVSCLQFV